MNRSSFALLGSVVLATTSLGVTPSASLAETQILEQAAESQLAQNPEALIQSTTLPQGVADAVIKDAIQRTGMTISQLRIMQVKPQTWSDSCLGLGGPAESCALSLVPGWQTVIGSNTQRWVYRTDASGSQVRWDQAASQTMTAEASRTTSTSSRVTNRTTRTTTVERVPLQTPRQSTTQTTQTQTTQQTTQNQTRTDSQGIFSLAVWQPSGQLSNVIARMSVKPRRDTGYAAERYIGDFRYKLKQRVKFTKGLNPGDRVMVRLYDTQNRLIGFSAFEALSENSVVNLILPARPNEVRVVRTVQGIDADEDGNIDAGTEVYDNFSQVSGTGNQQRVTFLTNLSNIQTTGFQVEGLPAPSTTSVYTSSFSSGEYSVTRESMSLFSSDMPAVLSSVPGRLTPVTNVASSYDISQLLAKYRDIGTNRNVQVRFSDVPSRHWARSFIGELAAQEIIKGFPNNTFRPDQPMTRAEFTALISLAFKKPRIRELGTIKDVSTDLWYHSYIEDAYEMGFVDLDADNSFDPLRPITRFEIMQALVKGLNYSATSSTETVSRTFSDISKVSSENRSVVAAAVENGLIVNHPNVKVLEPDQRATRAEASAFIYQAMVSQGNAQAISSPYIVKQTTSTTNTNRATQQQRQTTETQDRTRQRQNCNQGIGNGAEGCDPGNSSPRGGSNDEGGRTPGGQNR